MLEVAKLRSLEEWFTTERTLINTDVEKIELDFWLELKADIETEARLPYIQNKYNRSEEEHREVIKRGLIIEHHIRWFIQSRWGALYVEPENAGQPDKWCNHDFRLRLSFGLVSVDVAGRNRYGEYGAVSGKPTADLHILGDIVDGFVVVTGIEMGSVFHARRFVAEQAQPWPKLQELLNIEAGHCGYTALSDAFKRRIRKS